MPPAFERYRLSGRVTDMAGAPVSGVSVEIEYAWAGRDSTPPSWYCNNLGICFLTVQTNARGEYAAEFTPGGGTSFYGANARLGMVWTHLEGYGSMVQWLPGTSATATLNLRLRRAQAIRAGESTIVTFEPDSSLCTDFDTLLAMDHRCETVVIDSGAGTLVVEARAVGGGGTPMIYGLGEVSRHGHGTVSIPVRGGQYVFLVGVPDGEVGRQGSVSAALR